MKKILTVLLALSVVFTYTVGTAFAATPSDSKADAINALNEVANEVKGDISYYAGTGYIDPKSDGAWAIYGDFIDNVLAKNIIEQAVQKIFRTLYEKGDIYKSHYEGWYCTPCESFWTETQLKDGKCPDCGREVVRSEEEAYFFRLSKYADRLVRSEERRVGKECRL